MINASPRPDGNSAVLAKAAAEGASAGGAEVRSAFLSDYVDRLFGNCRQCRSPESGLCTLDDRYSELLLDLMLPADGIIVAMPLYYYGMPGRLKTVFDRLFCYTSNSAPQQHRTVAGIQGKKVGVLISCEESYLGATLGVTAQWQEATRYLNQELVGVVVGRANSRGEIIRDPTDPVAEARALAGRLYMTRVSDYRIDTERSTRVWD